MWICVSTFFSKSLKAKALLHNLHSVGGAVGVGGNDDGQAVGLLHLLTSHVEVANASNLLALNHLVDASPGSYNELVGYLLALGLANGNGVSLI